MKFNKTAIIATILAIFATNSVQAQGLFDILKGLGQSTSTSTSGSNGTGIIGNLIEGIFNSSNITVADMTGNWDSTGPAVCFQGEGFLKKAGGVAAAAAIESKLAPYYEQYGLNNAVLTVDQAGNFTLKIKLLTMRGTITQAEGMEKGVFMFNFTALGSMKLGSLKTYVQKTSGTMDVMFDATKLKAFISAVAKLSGIKMAKTLSSLLDQYDGLCVGFHFSKVKGTSSGKGTSEEGRGTSNVYNGANGAAGIGSILDIFGFGMPTQSQQNNSQNGVNSGNGNNSGNGKGYNTGNSNVNNSGNVNGNNSGSVIGNGDSIDNGNAKSGLELLREALQKKKKK